MRLGTLAADINGTIVSEPLTPIVTTGCYDSESGVQVDCASGAALPNYAQEYTDIMGGGQNSGGVLPFPYVGGPSNVSGPSAGNSPTNQAPSPWAYLGGTQPQLVATQKQGLQTISPTTWMLLAAVVGGMVLFGGRR